MQVILELVLNVEATMDIITEHVVQHPHAHSFL
jgi:hypothetical protein